MMIPSPFQPQTLHIFALGDLQREILRDFFFFAEYVTLLITLPTKNPGYAPGASATLVVT